MVLLLFMLFTFCSNIFIGSKLLPGAKVLLLCSSVIDIRGHPKLGALVGFIGFVDILELSYERGNERKY